MTAQCCDKADICDVVGVVGVVVCLGDESVRVEAAVCLECL